MDRRLVRKILNGDHASANAWVKANYPSVQRFLWHLTGSRDEAADLTQQTFIRIGEALPGFRFECPLRSWVFRIAYREFQHWLRSRSRRPEVEMFDQPDPSQTLTEDTVLLLSALQKLPYEMSEAFWLREVEGLSVGEVSEALEIPEGTVKSRCHFARTKLRATLSGAYLPNQEQLEIDHAG